MGHSILFDYHDWLYVGLLSCDWDVGWGQGDRYLVPKEKQADSLQAIYLFFFFFGIPQKKLGKPGWDKEPVPLSLTNYQTRYIMEKMAFRYKEV
jgi:hypothetical protein